MQEINKLLGKIINADCMDVMKDIPDKYFELAIVDPQYGINQDGNTIIYGKGSRHKGFNVNIQHYKKKEWDKKVPNKNYFNELFRISKNQIIWGGNYFTDKIPVSRGWIYWDKKCEWCKSLFHCDWVT